MIEYIEVTADDIAQANALAHEVLGRSLDELPPQTRRLLGALCTLVAERMQRQHAPPSEVRFSRREVHEATAWGDTQLRMPGCVSRPGRDWSRRRPPACWGV